MTWQYPDNAEYLVQTYRDELAWFEKEIKQAMRSCPDTFSIKRTAWDGVVLEAVQAFTGEYQEPTGDWYIDLPGDDGETHELFLRANVPTRDFL